MAEDRRRGRDRLDAAEHALAQPPRSEGGDVLGSVRSAPAPPARNSAQSGIDPRESQRLDVGQRQRGLHGTRLTPYSGEAIGHQMTPGGP